MKQRIALCVGLVAIGLSASAQAQAQPVPPYYPGAAYPGRIYPGAGPALPPYEIVALVRSTGLEPLSRPMRQGPVYVLRALDPAGQELRVIADARLGRILKVVPVAGPRYVGPIMPPPYGRPTGRMVPDGPTARVAALPPGTEGAPVNGPAVGNTPAAQASPPPLPRPRPKVAAAVSPAVTPETTGAIPAPATPAPPPADEQAE